MIPVFDVDNPLLTTFFVDEEGINVDQFVQEVPDFSSQYGSDISISYTAYNIVGKPSKFPDYGDFPQAFVMRTYGKWWNEAPSKPPVIMPQNYGPIESQDYIDLMFEERVYPEKVCIYETYNPGSVVRIWAGNGHGAWKILWEGAPQVVGHSPRLFSPEINQINFQTCLLRLEFDHSKLDYYTELDAVLLAGSRVPKVPHTDVKEITSKILDLNIHAISNEIDISHNLSSLSSLAQHYSALIEDINQVIESSNSIELEEVKSFNSLPDETILKIFSYLDLISLCKCSCVNRQFNRLATDTMLYTQVGLKPYWHCVSTKTLNCLSMRCHYLQKLDLSWCGNYGLITSKDFIAFINECGKQITHLRLDCCKFIDGECMQNIADCCRNIRELTLRNCLKILPEAFLELTKVNTLQRLDLYRTAIETEPLVKILQSSPALQHINLGSCVRVSSMDEVAQALGSYNRELISVDFWKTYSLTPVGVKALSQCSKLEEIDLGWCLGVSIPGDCMSALASGCKRLRKLFMAALRGITDRDLVPFLEHCPHLQQLDLLGVRSITTHICHRLLTNCKELKLFDISFCDQIKDEVVEEWRQQFPRVSIKRSFQSDGVPSPFHHY